MLDPSDVEPAPPSLQQARKAFARGHICDAARDLFFRHGYAATTFEQIAKAAGTRRTTLYSHFTDKAEILEAIGLDYYAGLGRIIETLPGPVPDRAAIDKWIADLVAFVVSQKTPATLLIGLGVGHDTPSVVQKVSQSFQDALAARFPAFARAEQPGPEHAYVRALSKIILRELGLGCLEAAREDGDGCALLGIVADMFEKFVRDYA
ncbi:TetR/AcrR family transcriptional regulator [Sphingomonas sp. BIUV-7]|uniref:TetR/AcrR family transcriptional regulator n=1 Tax=Sphingomonas natans TaxID=3063330 RepID=A0ABT8Y816_9SPHN|nr:TetR/AcrR family transcriptional regulator [Sphingomonas sp. BIUV-7]MDO6414472.1 TetR/AcrR family transcriptional regulator [Sphingomonas sp. BIUV-7]